MYWFYRIYFLLKRNSLFEEIRAQLQHRNVNKYPRLLPSISIDEIVPNISTKLLNLEITDGDVSNIELEYICRIVKGYCPRNIFEIGTFNGRTTLNLAANSGSNTMIFTVDLPREDLSRTKYRIKSGEKKFIRKSKPGVQFIGTEYEGRITQIYSDSATLDYEPYKNKMDMVFIDGSHSYEYVLSDTHNALELLRNRKGVIIWHDYGWNEVVQAINEFYLNENIFSNLKQIEGTSFAYIRFE